MRTTVLTLLNGKTLTATAYRDPEKAVDEAERLAAFDPRVEVKVLSNHSPREVREELDICLSKIDADQEVATP